MAVLVDFFSNDFIFIFARILINKVFRKMLFLQRKSWKNHVTMILVRSFKGPHSTPGWASVVYIGFPKGRGRGFRHLSFAHVYGQIRIAELNA